MHTWSFVASVYMQRGMMGTVRAGSARGGKSVVAGEVSVVGLCGNLMCRRRDDSQQQFYKVAYG